MTEETVVPDGQAASSPADVTADPSTEASLLDSVMEALGQPEDTPPVSEPSEVQASEPPEEAPDPEDPEPEAAEDGKLPFSAHPRFKQLLSRDKERKQLAAEVEPLRTKLTELEPKAGYFDKLTGYIEQANMNSEDFTNLLRMGRLMKNDPVAFHEAFKPHWEKIESAVGARMPDDLKAKVEDGSVDEATARELARTRAEAALASERIANVHQQTERDRDRALQAQQQAQLNEIGNSVSTWERQWKSADPDYAKKQPRVMDRVMRLLQESPPKSKDDALAICAKARKDVDEEIRQLLPQKQGIRPNGSGTSSNATREPQTALEAANWALEQMSAR